MKYSKVFYFIQIFLLSNVAFSQKIATEKNYVWMGYLTQMKINERISMWNDIHWVPENFIILRSGATVSFRHQNKINTTLGIAYAWFYPKENNTTYRPEIRPWGQTTLTQKMNQSSLFHRVRYEARYRRTLIDDELTNEFNFNYRVRYLLQFKYQINKDSDKIYLVTSDEILYNIGEEISNSIEFDQNRIMIGAGLHSKNITLQIGYLNQLLKISSSTNFNMNHNLYLFVFHDLNWTKKE